MSKIIFVHSEQTRESRDKLKWIHENGIDCEVVDFMEIRDKFSFQGVPSVLILKDDSSMDQESVVATLFNDEITIENLQKDYSSSSENEVDTVIISV